MNRSIDIQRVGRRRRDSAFTLIELLVVMAITAALIGLLAPALRMAREQGSKSVCISNLRQVSSATLMYDIASSGGAVTVPWYQTPVHPGYSPGVITPWVFGGFRAPAPTTNGEGAPDSSLYPAQLRPLNQYIDPMAAADARNLADRGKDIIKAFICPGDRTYASALIGSAGEEALAEQQTAPSWRANGSSYSLNTRFMQGYKGNDFRPALADSRQYAQMSAQISRAVRGGTASEFIVWVEQGFYSATYNAAPTIGHSEALPQRAGWHRKFSSWAMSFADGHAVYGYYDTRLTRGPIGTIWEPGFKFDPATHP